MLVKDIMTKDVIAVSPEIAVGEVAKLMSKNRIHGIPVVENGAPIGMITETDFFTKGAMTVYLPEYIDFLKRDVASDRFSHSEKEKVAPLLETKAKDIMSFPCINIDEEADVVDFLSLVRNNNLTSVSVVNKEKKLTGIITVFDVIRFINVDPGGSIKK